MTARLSRGFTLIELLVVVAIISLISSVIITSTSNARERAQDTTVKRNLATVRAQAALYQHTNSGYGTPHAVGACPTSGASMFFADATIRSVIQGAAVAGGGATRCASTASGYAVSVKLRSSPNHWCVDSQGESREITNTAWTGVACP